MERPGTPTTSGARTASAGQAALSAEAFAGQFSGCFRRLWLVAVGVTHNPTLADDVVQEAAIIGLEKRAEFAQGTSFAAWMSQIVRFVALNVYRKQRKRQGVDLAAAPRADRATHAGDPLESTPLELGPGGKLPADQAHFDDRVMGALAEVDEVACACLLLRTIEELEYSEISELLKIPPGTAMSHVHRTRKFLRERLAGAFGAADQESRTDS